MQTRVRPPVWLWFNLLSIDAPLIALVWQDFLSRCYPTLLRPAGRIVLGLTVWAIYLADRLLDVRHPAPAPEPSRHGFCRRHRAFAQTLFALIVCVDLVVCRTWLRPAVLDNGLLLTGGVAVYLGAFPFTGWNATKWKKPIAAILFTAGIFVVAWSGASHSAIQLVLWPAVAFCALCLANLVTIERWSREAAASDGSSGYGWGWLLLPITCLVGARDSNWFRAIFVSAAGLWALSRWGRKLSGDARCVLADALLLTPLLYP